MSGYLDTGAPGSKELLFLPLGGAGEIGMNLNLYGHDGQWLMAEGHRSWRESKVNNINK